MLLAVLRDVRECSMLLSGSVRVLLAVLRDVRECSMLLSAACVSAARCAQGRA